MIPEDAEDEVVSAVERRKTKLELELVTAPPERSAKNRRRR